MSKYEINDITLLLKSIHHKYEYYIDEYINNKQKIKIKCDIGHLFEMSVSQHLKGYKCPYCSGYKKTKEEILDELKIKHNNYYTYDNFNYEKLEDKIKIYCPEHGHFNQSIKLHRNGSKCPKCVNRYSPNNDIFIEHLKSIDDKMIYTNVNYINNKTQVKIICPEHGLILKIPQNIKKWVCDKCYITKKNFDEFKFKSIEKYGDIYHYDGYINNKQKIKIINKNTGFIYYQSPNLHLKCDYFYNKSNIDKFINNANNRHNYKYDYNESIYINNKQNIKINCKEHGYFEQTPSNHLQGAGCPKCNRFNQKEESLYDFIKSNYNGNIQKSNRSILNGKELDIYLPELKMAFEFNGLYWHSELYKDKNYHINKTKKCLEKNIQLIHIWEDDWDNKRDIVESIILNKIGKSEKIWARKCEIREVDNKSFRDFLIKNHIQGFVGSKVKLGLFYNKELVSLMTFGSLRRSLGQKSKDSNWELLRFSNKIGYTIIGGASKIFKYFLNNFEIDSIISYSDNSRGIGNLYKLLNFKFVNDTTPNYYYIVDSLRSHRFNWRKDILVSDGFDPTKTEVQIMNERGYYRIWDCGNKKWIYKK